MRPPFIKLLSLLLCCLYVVTGCHSKGNAKVSPADDLQQIKDSGELVILTMYSSTSYFLYRGQEMGFQYELGKEFAKSLGGKS
nr:CAZy families GH23 protein [uncultured Bacteroides sp.]